MRTAAGEGEPDLPDGDVDARADLHEREPDRLTVRAGQLGAGQAKSPERVEQDT